MVHYIGVEGVGELVAEVGFVAFVDGLVDEIETDFARWPCFEKSARHAIHSKDGVIELMPISDGTTYSFKYVNGHPGNTADGLLTVTAFGVLADVQSGYPLLLSELTLTTALRTAAMSVLAARYLARPDSRTMALIGNGAQSEFQALAFHHLLGIRTLRLYDCDAAATAKLERNLKRLGLPDLTVVRAASIVDAVRGADIVTTVTADKRNATIVTGDLVERGMHLNAVGGDCPGKTELDPAILRRDDVRVVVEYEPQSRIEGEVQQMPADYPVIEFAECVAGTAVGRRNPADVTVFDSVGFALEDFSALRYLHRLFLASRHPRRTVDLLPTLADPKDLYGALAVRRPVAAARDVAVRA